jgi:two-component system phosphate regulon response regulator PhoB
VLGALRNIVFRFDDSPAFARALEEGEQELLLPDGEGVRDGEWVLAIFDVGTKRRSTAAAARGLHRGPTAEPVLSFERRDWERLVDFAEATSVRTMEVPLPPDPPTEPQLYETDRASSTRLSNPPDTPRGEASSFGQAAHARVLLVDDDSDICDVVGAMLDAVGLAVESAASGEEAFERVRSEPYDLVVLDWNLPGMTGIELCRLIRKDPALYGLPVLFLTAQALSRDIVEAFANGADDYVVKPFRAPELGARIFGLLRRARMTAASP